jgi:predicted amidohydrolase
MECTRRGLLKMISCSPLVAAGALATAHQGRSAGNCEAPPLAKSRLRVALIQVETTPDVQNNYSRAIQMAREAGREKPDLMVLPELFAVGYRPEGPAPHAQTVPGPASREFAAVARETGSHIIFGLPQRVEAGIYNTLALVGPNGLIGLYQKTHLAYDPRHPTRNEQQLFLPGRRLGRFETACGALGLFICHDGVFPEVPRCLTLDGADLLVWCLYDGEPMNWAPQHVYYNLIPLVAVNPVQRVESKWVGGGSALLAADGKVICQSREPKEEFLIGEVDLAQGRELRLKGEVMQDFFRVRRPDLYGAIVRRKPCFLRLHETR